MKTDWTDHEAIFRPFCDKESGVAYLDYLIEKDGFSRKTTYLLQLLINLISNGKTILKRTPPETLRGLSKRGRRNVEASLIARTNDCSDRWDSQGVGSSEGLKPHLWDRTIRRLSDWAESRGAWFDGADGVLADLYGERVGFGAEANVYCDGVHVVKSIGIPFNPVEAMDRIAVTNFLFPETALELIGFGRRADGEFCMVVRQPFIHGGYVEDACVHVDVLNDFRPDPDGAYAVFCNDRYVLGDLHDRNVLRSPGGNLFVIDCNASLNTPSIGKGGTWVIPPVDYTIEAVREMDSLLDELLPSTCGRQWLVDTFRASHPDLETYLLRDGRYPGVIGVKMRDGTRRGIVVEVDPDAPDEVLWMDTDRLAVLLDGRADLSVEDRRSVLCGCPLRRPGGATVFSLDRGDLVAAEGGRGVEEAREP